MSTTVKTFRTRAFVSSPNSDEVLVLIRHYSNCDVIMLPGGGIDEGETPEQSLRRETTEELGVELHDVELFYNHQNTRRVRIEERNYFPTADFVENNFYFYSASISNRNDIKLLEPEKFKEYSWVKPSFIASYAKRNKASLSDGITEAVDLFIKRQSYSKW